MTRRRRTFLAAALVTVALVLYSTWSFAAPWMRSRLSPEQISLVIAADKEIYSLGERPKITATLTNKSGKTIMLVPALDGSGRGRFPYARFDVTPPPDALPEEVLGMCGNTNPILLSDFRRVGPNQSFEICQPWGGPWPTELDRGPGEYSLQLTYSTDDDKVEQWLGGPMSSGQESRLQWKIGALLGEVPRFTVKSNVLTITFENPFPSPEAMLRNGTLTQATIALRLADAGHPVNDLPAAIVESMLVNINFSDAHYMEYCSQAMQRLSTCVDEPSLARLWVAIESPGSPFSSLFQRSECGLAMLHTVLACPGPNREARLRFLVEYRDTGTHGGRQIYFSDVHTAALCESSGEDIDRLLRDLYDDAVVSGRFASSAFDVIKTEVERRRL